MSDIVRVAIDTATDRLSVAVAAGGRVLEGGVDGARRHAAMLVPLLDRLLRSAGAVAGDIALVAVAEGPGSFTGIRVGVSAAKALVAGGRAALCTAPSLLVRAAAVGRPGETVLAVSSALRGELYAGAWRFGEGGRIATVLVPRTIGPADFRELPPVDRLCGGGPPDLIGALEQRVGRPRHEEACRPPSAAVLLTLVGRPGGARVVPDAATWEPVYGRPAEAQAQWERIHGRTLPHPTGDAG